MENEKEKSSIYFSHDANARNDEKILELRANYGWNGYGIFWALVEMMRETADGLLKRDFLTGLCLSLGVEKTWLEEFLKFCIDSGLFVMTEGNKFTSPSLQRRLQKMENKSRIMADAGRRGAQKRWGKSDEKPAESDNSKAEQVPEEKIPEEPEEKDAPGGFSSSESSSAFTKLLGELTEKAEMEQVPPGENSQAIAKPLGSQCDANSGYMANKIKENKIKETKDIEDATDFPDGSAVGSSNLAEDSDGEEKPETVVVIETPLQPTPEEPPVPPKKTAKEILLEEVLAAGEKFAEWFKSTLPEDRRVTPADLEAWKDVFRLLRINDKRTEEEIYQLCTYFRNHYWWKNQFLGAGKLRKKNDDGVTYYDYFLIQYKKENGNGNGKSEQRQTGSSSGAPRRQNTTDWSSVKQSSLS